MEINIKQSLEQESQQKESYSPSPQARALMDYLDCPCRYFPPILDDDEIVSAYKEAQERGKREGFVPMLVAAEDDTLWECLLINSGKEDSFDRKTVAAYREKALQTVLPPGEEAMAQFLKNRREEMEAAEIDWKEEVVGEITGGQALNGFMGYWDYRTRATQPLILAEIPVKYPWEIFAWLPFGGWNECPDTSELMAVAKYWQEKHGAVPAVMTHDVLEFVLPAPVKGELALELALEQYAWCPDLIEQGGEDASVGNLAAGLTKSTSWYFWWD